MEELKRIIEENPERTIRILKEVIQNNEMFIDDIYHGETLLEEKETVEKMKQDNIFIQNIIDIIEKMMEDKKMLKYDFIQKIMVDLWEDIEHGDFDLASNLGNDIVIESISLELDELSENMIAEMKDYVPNLENKEYLTHTIFISQDLGIDYDGEDIIISVIEIDSNRTISAVYTTDDEILITQLYHKVQ